MIIDPYRFGVPFAPTDIAGCSSLFDGRFGVTEVGGAPNNVAAWNDQSGNGRHLGLSLGDFSPQTGIDTLNGHNVIKFDSNSWIGRNAAWVYAAGAATMFLVAKTSVTTSIFVHESHSTNSDAQYNVVAITDFASHTNVDDSATTRLVNITTIDVVDGAYHLWTIKDTGSNSAISIDRGAPVTLAYTRGTATFNRFTLGASRRGAVPSALQIVGDIATVITYNSVLSAGDTTLVQDYILATWGV